MLIIRVYAPIITTIFNLACGNNNDIAFDCDAEIKAISLGQMLQFYATSFLMKIYKGNPQNRSF